MDPGTAAELHCDSHDLIPQLSPAQKVSSAKNIPQVTVVSAHASCKCFVQLLRATASDSNYLTCVFWKPPETSDSCFRCNLKQVARIQYDDYLLILSEF